MRFSILACLAASWLLAQSAAAQTAHTKEWPPLLGATPAEASEALKQGPQLERDRSAKWLLTEHRKLNAALRGLATQRTDVVDAYVISVALDSDAVFEREAREAGRVLGRRFDAAGRTLVLAGSVGTDSADTPKGSLDTLTIALARVAELMDKDQDVLVLYTTSHGAEVGLAYHDGDQGYGILSPARFAAVLDELGIRNRVLILSACYSGIFVPLLADADTALLTAASSGRTSFGCRAENDWTFFGDALINHALRKPQPLEAAGQEARDRISGWEMAGRLLPSNPQVVIGSRVERWLKPLEARMPSTASAPTGQPAADSLKEVN